MTSPSHIKTTGNSSLTGLEIDPAWFGVPPDTRAFQRTFDDVLNAQSGTVSFDQSDGQSATLSNRFASFEGDAMQPNQALEATVQFRIAASPSGRSELSESDGEGQRSQGSSDSGRSVNDPVNDSKDAEPVDEASPSSDGETPETESDAVGAAETLQVVQGKGGVAGPAGKTTGEEASDGDLEADSSAETRKAAGEELPEETDVDPAAESELGIEALAEETEQPRHALANSGDPRPPAVQSGYSGTAAAELEADMENGQEQKEFADAPEQNLPEDPELASAMDGSAEETETPSPIAKAAAAADTADDPDFEVQDEAELIQSTEIDPLEYADVVESGEEVGELEEMRPISPLRMIERVQDQVSRIALELRRFDARTLSVVLRPDSMTRLSVQLKLESGQIEMQARFESGDFAGFNSHWPQLQQELAGLGIRVAPLESVPAEAAPDLGRDGGRSAKHSDSNLRERDGGEDGGSNDSEPMQTVPVTDSASKPGAVANADSNGKPDGWEQWA